MPKSSETTKVIDFLQFPQHRQGLFVSTMKTEMGQATLARRSVVYTQLRLMSDKCAS